MNSGQNPKKAIIPVAGWGSRRLPITKAVEKCMLPICNRPTVDYCVEQCIAAGIEDIFFVVSPEFQQLRAYYSASTGVEAYLASRGQAELLDELRAIPSKANFHYIVQDPVGPYGTAVPLWLARDAVADDTNFMVLFGDGFVYREDGENDIERMKAGLQKAGAKAAALGVEETPERLAGYGAMKTSTDASGNVYLRGIVEKPRPGTAPSNLANVSYYILGNDIMPYIEQTLEQGNAQGEHYLTDAVTAYAASHPTVAILSSGRYLDGGSLEGWIEANNIMYADKRFKH